MISIRVVFPICLTVMLGYAAQRMKLVPKEAFDSCIKLCFKVLIPLRLFMNIGSSNLGEVFNPTLVLVVLGVEAGFWCLCMLVIPRIQKDVRKRGAMVQGSFRGNFVLFGIPIAESIAGAQVMGAASLIGAIMTPFYTTLTVTALELFRAGKPDLKHILKGIMKNPLIIGSLLGLAWMFTGFEMPVLLYDTLDDLARTATPLALFSLGGTFKFASAKNNLKPLVLTTASKLIILPAIMFAVGLACGLKGPLMSILLGVASTPIPVSSFPLVENMGGDGEFAGQLVVMTAALCFITIFGWVFLLTALGLM